MPRIRCRYVDCIYLESGFCGTDQIDLDPELGCLTYTQEEEEALPKEAWEEEEVLEEEEEEEEWDEEDLEDEEFEDFDEDEDEEEDEDW
jgi:hypothetical protein